MHNDEPTLVDLLDREFLVREVSEAVATCAPPQVFGVHGDWGLGKTSFLQQVQWYLTGECPQQTSEETQRATTAQGAGGKYQKNIRTVWFEAWRYQHEEAPVVALLHEMRSQLAWRHQAVDAAHRGVETVLRGALHSLEGITTQIGFQYSKFRDANREWQTKNLAAALPSHTLREHLSKALGQLLPPASSSIIGSTRIAVFVDDVDRCEPDAAYRLLEGLKIYLTLDNCVFILGMNQKTVEDALDRAIGSELEDPEPEAQPTRRQRKWRAAAYMEKLCQNVWRLPVVHNPGELLGNLINRTVQAQSLKPIQNKLTDTQCLPRNPRRLKGLANLVGRLAHRLPEDASSVHVQMLLIVAYIYQFHPDLYTRWQAEPPLYDRIAEWCRVGRTDVAVLKALALPKGLKADDETEPFPQGMESMYQDLGPLSELREMESLDLAASGVSELGPLSGLGRLRFLGLWGTEVNELGALAALGSLEDLSLGATNVDDVDSLRRMTKLEDLDLSGTRVTDVGPLGELSELKVLRLAGTKVKDLGPLAQLAGLRLLDLRGTEVGDVEPLFGLDGLRVLRLGEGLAARAVEELRRRLSECTVEVGRAPERKVGKSGRRARGGG